MRDDRVTRHEITLFGPTGTNGLVGTQKQLVADVREMKSLVSSVTITLRTLRWSVLAMGVLAATMKPETLAHLLRALASIVKLSA